MLTFNRLAVVLAATGVMSLVTVPTAAARAAGATAGRTTAGGTVAGGTAATAARGIRHPLWVAAFHGPPGGKSQALAEAVSPDGARLFVTGSLGLTAISPSKRWATISYGTAAGRRHWLQYYQGTDTSSDSTAAPVAVAVSPDGSTVFVTGYVTNTGGVRAEATVAYDTATGARRWVAQHIPVVRLTDVSPVAVAVSPDGSRVFVLSNDYTAQAYDTATGNLVWSAIATGLHGISFVFAGAMSPDGSRLFLTGSGFTPANREEFQTAALDAATGATLWVQHYIKPHQPFGALALALAVAVSPDGSMVYVAGQVPFSGLVLGDDAATGALRWARFPSLAAATEAVSPNGSSVFFGGPPPPSSGVFVTQAREPDTGTLLWTHPQTSRPSTVSSRTTLRAMAVSPDGSRLVVTGRVLNGVTQAMTIAYNPANGRLLWSAGFALSNQGVEGTTPAAVVVSPDSSRVFVTGLGTPAVGNWNFVTVAYRA
jgi:DNA-binding beta-propeller fold protein YncE